MPDPIEREVIVLKKSFLGLFARFAVQQSPYPCPDGLSEVLATIAERFNSPAENGPKHDRSMGTLMYFLPRKRAHVQGFIRNLMADIPQIEAWNSPKVGNATIGIVTAYDREDDRVPDADFIDLEALVQNVAHALLMLDD